MALCALHHELFDHGAYSVTLGRDLQVSELAHGATGFGEWLLAFHGKLLRKRQSPRHRPEEQFIDWHQREVFWGSA